MIRDSGFLQSGTQSTLEEILFKLPTFGSLRSKYTFFSRRGEELGQGINRFIEKSVVKGLMEFGCG